MLLVYKERHCSNGCCSGGRFPIERQRFPYSVQCCAIGSKGPCGAIRPEVEADVIDVCHIEDGAEIRVVRHIDIGR